MSYTAPVVSYSTTLNGTYTTLTGVQSVQINRGRKRFQDPFNNNVAIIELIPDTYYATPLEVGQFIDVRVTNSATAEAYFAGRISDVQRSYGMPWNLMTNYAPADRYVITAQGAMGALGQAGTVGITSTAGAGELIVDLVQAVDVAWDVKQPEPFPISVTVDDPNDTEPVLDALNKIANAAQLFLDDVDPKRDPVTVYWPSADFQIYAYSAPSSRAFTLSDTPGVGKYAYTFIEYLSGAQTAFTQVQTNAYSTSVAAQIASTGNAPYNSLIYDTKLNSTANLNSLANFILTLNNETEPTPIIVRTDTAAAPGCEALTYMVNRDDFYPTGNAFLLGAIVTIEFRGSTVRGLLQGLSISFYADRANVEFYLSPYLGIPFTLDSSISGILDTNRLGYP